MLSTEERARLVWSCRRGMLELDLILNGFLQHGLHLLTEEQTNTFKTLLTHTDPELFSWLMGHETSYNKELASLVDFIRTHN